jgi:hypothetical protein
MPSNALYDGKQLDDWLISQGPGEFPGNIDYPERYKAIHEYLRKEVYPEVEKAALWAEVKAGRAPVYLTNHGEEHVQHVISKATDLLGTSTNHPDSRFQPYEVFVLLIAILFHDVGNVFGRKDHQKRCGELMTQLGTALFPDEAEKRVVRRIAGAHCGIVNGTRDVIGQLRDDYELFGCIIHKQALASILRLSDELADDRMRASRFMLGSKLLDGSEAYHEYSNALRSVIVRDGEISFAFELTKDLATRKLDKAGQKVYLLDEIYDRTLKAHIERTYCMRFLRRQVSVDRIRVKIELFNKFDPSEETETIHPPISYCLCETGYPEAPVGGIHSLCPELNGLTGKELRQELK